MEAQTAADSAAAQLDPRLLQPEGGDSERGEPKKAAQASPEDLRAQLEQLLNALINR